MSVEETKIIITGATGEVGTYASLFMARLGAADHLYIASRNPHKAANVFYNSQVNAVMRGQKTKVEPLALDIPNVDKTAEELLRIKPTVILNSAAAMSLYPFFPAMRRRQRKMGMIPGFAHTLPKDMALLWPLMRAVKMAVPDTIIVNLAAPDIASTILSPVGLAPNVGAGTLDSTVHGVKLGIAKYLNLPPHCVEVRMISHHAIRRHPAKEVPFILRVYVKGEDYTHRFDQEQLCGFIDHATDITGVETMNTPVTSNASVTAASGVETSRCILLNTGEIRHGSGVKGIPGGTPVRLSREKIEIVLPEGVNLEEAVHVNTIGMKLDGLESIDQDGTVHFTEKECYWLKKGLGLKWKTMRLDEAGKMWPELDAAYKRMKKEEETA